MRISEAFTKLDEAMGVVDTKKQSYDDLESKTAVAYKEYTDAFKVANDLKVELTTQLEVILPPPNDRVRVSQ